MEKVTLDDNLYKFIKYMYLCKKGGRGNFHLTSATNNGISLPSPFNMDMDGKTRGSDGTWDRGAYEYP